MFALLLSQFDHTTAEICVLVDAGQQSGTAQAPARLITSAIVPESILVWRSQLFFVRSLQ
jgi:hypothetical protein